MEERNFRFQDPCPRYCVCAGMHSARIKSAKMMHVPFLARTRRSFTFYLASPFFSWVLDLPWRYLSYCLGTLYRSECCDLIFFYSLQFTIPTQSLSLLHYIAARITRRGFLFLSASIPFFFSFFTLLFHKSSVWPQCNNDINPNDRLSPAFHSRKHALQFITFLRKDVDF